MSYSYKPHQFQPQSFLNRATFGSACAQHCWYWDVWYWNLTYALRSKIISDCNFVPGCALSAQTPHRTHGCAICKYIWTRKFWAPARKQNISRKMHLLKENENLHGSKKKPNIAITIMLLSAIVNVHWLFAHWQETRNRLLVSEQDTVSSKRKGFSKISNQTARKWICPFLFF